MKSTLFLLDIDPLLDFVEGRLHASRSGQALNRAWLADQCYFCPLSLFAGPLLLPDGSRRQPPKTAHLDVALLLTHSYLMWRRATKEIKRLSCAAHDVNPRLRY